ncbi:MAG: SpoIIIAC/SpoIIIAD family protein [Candidatus Borkfalkiaceae bacterium]|nr:SpoIIIAC/SpoIIIAD family protein [Christensenellaceae bacterium]
MEVYKIVAVGLVCAVIVVWLKSVGSEYALLAAIASSVLLLTMTLSYVIRFVGFFTRLSETTGVSSEVVVLVLKILGISYLIEFSSSLIEDFGLKSLSEKVVFAGKIVILTLSVPVMESVVSAVLELL